MNPAALRALLEGSIEAQEKQGQSDFNSKEILPIKIKGGTRQEMKSFGVVYGKPVDDLFIEAKLPEGWKKEPMDHPMWSKLLDDQGRERALIFYKATFYDRDAFISITR